MKYTFYRICCKDPDIKDCYVSASTDLDKTISKHTKRIKKDNQGLLYQCIRDNGGVSNWNVIPFYYYDTIKENEDITPILKHFILSYNANLNYL